MTINTDSPQKKYAANSTQCKHYSKVTIPVKDETVINVFEDQHANSHLFPFIVKTPILCFTTPSFSRLKFFEMFERQCGAFAVNTSNTMLSFGGLRPTGNNYC